MGRVAKLKQEKRRKRELLAQEFGDLFDFKITPMPEFNPSNVKFRPSETPDLSPGDLVQIAGGLMNLPPVRAVFESRMGDLLYFSIGELQMAASIGWMQIEKLTDPAPKCWLEEEVKYLRASTARCPCEDCMSQLRRKEQLLAARTEMRVN